MPFLHHTISFLANRSHYSSAVCGESYVFVGRVAIVLSLSDLPVRLSGTQQRSGLPSYG